MHQDTNMRLTVVIPIFRVEAFIERCARSLMEQTLDNVEYIFVDDCSPDGSINILRHVLKEYPQRNVKIIRHNINRGLPAARNTGLAHATGKYIFHCDSDDYIECDALERMYKKAIETDADIVYSDWYLTFPLKERYMSCPAYTRPKKALQALLHGTMKYNVWNKLVRRSLYVDHNISFPEGHGMGEDMTMILLFAQARSVTYLPYPTYHYVRQNENAYTAINSEASHEDLLYNANYVIKTLTGHIPEKDIACFKLNVKYPLLISDKLEDYDRWLQWFPEANKYISFHQVSARAQLLEKSAKIRFFLPLRIHYHLLSLFL